MDDILSQTARISQIFLAIVAFFIILKLGETIFAPIGLGLVVATMFLPAVRFMEIRGLRRGISGVLVVGLVCIMIIFIVIGLALPIADFIEKAPVIWKNFRIELAGWKDVLGSVQSVQRQFSNLFADRSLSNVQVQNSGGMQSVLALGPKIVAEFLLFIVTVLFFILNAWRMQHFLTKLPLSRRFRVALVRILRDVENSISRYLLTIAAINLGVGLVVWGAMAIIGLPNPHEWGILAAILNFLPVAGPAIMAVMLVLAGFASSHNTLLVILPATLYLGLHFLESQVLTSQVLGMTTKLNPFSVFLSFAFWIWLWGPPGGFVAIPAMLLVRSIAKQVMPEKPVKTAIMASPQVENPQGNEPIVIAVLSTETR